MLPAQEKRKVTNYETSKYFVKVTVLHYICNVVALHDIAGTDPRAQLELNRRSCPKAAKHFV